MMTSERIVIIVGAVIATLLQILLAPHISIGFAFPSFMLAYCLAMAVARPNAVGPVLPFVMGLIFDLISGGPVGAMALCLTIIASAASSVFRRSPNDTPFMAVAVMAVCVLLTELLYGIIFLLFGYATSFPEAFVYRILPCFLYDLVISLVIYLIIARILGQGGNAPIRSEIKQL